MKQLKNRYNDPTKYKRFVLGIDRAKMQLYDVEDSAQEDLVENMKQKAPEKVEVVEEHGFDKLKENRNEKKYKDFSSFKI